MTCSPWQLKRKCPGSMTPAWTGPTATSWISAPATVKKFRFSEKIIERMLRLRWWELELEELSGLPYRDVERCLDRVEEIRVEKFRG